MTELSYEERLKESLEVIEMQREKLKLCRVLMRDNGIGHLYPGSTVEYEENMKMSMADGSPELVQSLYSSIAHQKVRASKDKKIANEYIKKLLQFIEFKDISPQELQKFIDSNFEVKELAE